MSESSVVVAATAQPPRFDVQKWLDGGAPGLLPAGVHLIHEALIVYSIYDHAPAGQMAGSGRGQTVIRKAPGFPASQPMLVVVGGYDFKLVDITLDGADLPTTNSLLALVNTECATTRDSAFENAPFMGVALSGCVNPLFDATRFRRLGNPSETEEGGPAIWANETCTDGSIINCYFVDCEWSGAYLWGLRWIFTGNHGLRCHESWVFGGPSGSVFALNTVADQICKHIAGHPYEMGGDGNIYVANNIDGCDGEGVHIAGTWSVVVANLIRNAARDLSKFPGSGAISVFTVQPEGGPGHTLVTANLLGSTGSTPYGIVLARGNIPESHKITDTIVSGNLTSGNKWGKAAIACDPSESLVCGANVILQKEPA